MALLPPSEIPKASALFEKQLHIWLRPDDPTSHSVEASQQQRSFQLSSSLIPLRVWYLQRQSLAISSSGGNQEL
ncbi:hypothetical protein H671_1g1372 [Cricetulus griseus]|uniref:Uncharacterized protein n=1 Tax=Cricetulus griseus TaxID=10029 RepID=A0A061IMB2_CRIGR|nr:hypothetical protein H671_1g1372 [Cricetulus griseus]